MTDFDPRDQPAYSLAEAARYLKLPVATLRSWVAGRQYPRGEGVARFRPLIRPARGGPPTLSFLNLIEAHVLRALRTEHGVSIKAVRGAVEIAERHCGVDRLLLREELRTHAGELFLDQYGKLINLSATGQIAIRRMFGAYLKRVDWDTLHLPVRLYPFTAAQVATRERSIAIDPRISFGRPVVLHAGVSTAAIADRIDAGESPEVVAEDYELTPEQVEEAVVYERAA